MVLDLEIFVGHHSAPLVPLSPPDDVHPADAECVGAPDNRAHVEISQRIFDRDFETYTTSIERCHDLIVGLVLKLIEYIARICHYFPIVRQLARVYHVQK